MARRGKSPKHDFTNAEDLTIELPDGDEFPCHRSD